MHLYEKVQVSPELTVVVTKNVDNNESLFLNAIEADHNVFPYVGTSSDYQKNLQNGNLHEVNPGKALASVYTSLTRPSEISKKLEDHFNISINNLSLSVEPFSKMKKGVSVKQAGTYLARDIMVSDSSSSQMATFQLSYSDDEITNGYVLSIASLSSFPFTLVLVNGDTWVKNISGRAFFDYYKKADEISFDLIPSKINLSLSHTSIGEKTIYKRNKEPGERYVFDETEAYNEAFRGERNRAVEEIGALPAIVTNDLDSVDFIPLREEKEVDPEVVTLMYASSMGGVLKQGSRPMPISAIESCAVVHIEDLYSGGLSGDIEISGMTIARTGRMTNMNATEFENYISQFGAKYDKNVTKARTDLLIVADIGDKDTTTKIEQARKYGIPVMPATEFTRRLEEK